MRLHPTGLFDNHSAANRHIEARPLAAAMGAEICGVDAANISEGPFQETRALVIWHNRLCVYQAYNDYQGYRREMYRTTVRGDTPV